MHNRYTSPVIFILSVFFLISCGTLKEPWHSKEVSDWEQLELPIEKPYYSVYLIGDCGKPDVEAQEPVFKTLQSQLQTEGENSAVVFLGDNIYTFGLPDEDADDREKMEKRLDEQLKVAKSFPGQPFFIPGNHDWNHSKKGGLKAVQRQEEYVEAYLNRGNTFLPDDGCGDPHVVELSDSLIMIAISSQWWLHRWDKEPDINLGCEVTSKEEFLILFADILEQNKEKQIVIVTHHPFFTNGSHGGFYSWKEHLFPLTIASDKLMIPLPFLGSIMPIARKAGISRQDVANNTNAKYRKAILTLATTKYNITFASGHEHSLQFHDNEYGQFIVSGSGSKTSYARKGHGADMVHQHKGFSKLMYYRSGEVWVEFWIPEDDGTTGKMIFRKKIKEATVSTAANVEQVETEYTLEDDVAVTAASELYKAGKFKTRILGELHREEWLAVDTFPTIDLSKEHGGLVPVQRGGGFQTKSLRLENPEGKQWVLRSIEKDVDKVVPKFLKKTFAQKLVQDLIAASHPYAAVGVPRMADAAGVHHTNPKIVYLPPQENLGEYNQAFAGELYLYEERPAGDRREMVSFGNPKDMENTFKVIKDVQKDDKSSVDQRQVLRSRLFDILINDWDRHDDQWRWSEFKTDSGKVYQPVPRDRDQAFYKFDGALPWLASRKWLLRYSKFQSLDEEMYNLAGLTWNARYFDRTFLTEMERKDFINMAKELQTRLTDEVIEESVKGLPKTSFDIRGETIIAQLKGRRDILVEIAEEYYEILAKEVDIPGTNKSDYFEVERIDNEHTRVTVFDSNKKRKKKEVMYQRTFVNSETKEIRLYGLKGDDTFYLFGQVNKGIKIRMIGGGGEDKFENESRVRGPVRKSLVYDKKRGSEIIHSHRDLHDKRSNKDEVNDYDRKAFRYDQRMPLIDGGFNPDDGIFIGLGYSYAKMGFRHPHFAHKHTVKGSIAFATLAFRVAYESEFSHLVGRFNLNVNAHFLGPNFVQNYFGLGNNTTLAENGEGEERGLDYNRLRLRLGEFSLALKRRLNGNQSLKLGPYYQYAKLDQTTGRFVSDTVSMVSAANFLDKHYVGLLMEYEVDKTDNKLVPTRGFRIRLGGRWQINTQDSDLNYTQLGGEASVYFTFRGKVPLTVALRAGGAHNFGDFEFWQANTLGGTTNLRGYRAQRFAGTSSFFQNTELRWKILDFKTVVLPASIGLIGLFDVGRVWVKNDQSTVSGSSDIWHYGAGGGLWISPFNLAAISVTYTRSREAGIINFKFGMQF